MGTLVVVEAPGNYWVPQEGREMASISLPARACCFRKQVAELSLRILGGFACKYNTVVNLISYIYIYHIVPIVNLIVFILL